MEQIHILGTGNAMVTNCYNTCFSIEKDGRHFLVDAGGGNGILIQLKKANIPIDVISGIFVSHCHIDHILGVIWLIRAYGALAGKKAVDPLVIYGHEGVIKVLNTMMSMLLNQKQAKSLEGNLSLVEIKDGQKVNHDHVTVTFFDILSDKDKQFGGRMDLPSGKSLLFLGDEPYRNHEALYTQGVDYLMHEAFCLYGERDTFKPYEKHHATVKEACQVGHALNVPNLILYHTEDKHIKDRKSLYTSEGKAYYKGNLLVPDDLDVIRL